MPGTGPHVFHVPAEPPGKPKNTGVGSLSLLQGNFPTQESNLGLLHCRQILYHLSHQGSPRILEWVAYPFSRGSPWPRNWTGSPALQVDSLPAELSAAAAKSLQSCPTLCDPIDGSPPGSPAPGILQARILEWVAISSSNAWKWKVKVKSLSPTPSDPMDCSLPGSSVHGIFQARVLESGAIAFSELSYWGSPFPCMRSTNTNSISVCSLPPFQKNPFFPPWNCTWNPRLKQNGFVWSRNRG